MSDLASAFSDGERLRRLCDGAAAHSRDAAARLADCGEELLAVVTAAEQACWDHPGTGTGERTHQALEDALDALHAKVKAVSR